VEEKLRAIPIADANTEQPVIAKFREKYGAKDVKKYYSRNSMWRSLWKSFKDSAVLSEDYRSGPIETSKTLFLGAGTP
jgi:hypothetical protein